jgi:hypothetical protein
MDRDWVLSPTLNHVRIATILNTLLCCLAGVQGAVAQKIQNRLSELTELCTLQRLCEKVTNHIVSWAILNTQLAVLNPVTYKEVTNVDVSRASAAGRSAILLQKHGTLIALVYDVIMHGVPLSLHEILCPDHKQHHVVDSNYFGFHQALGVQPLLPRE